MLWLFGGSKRKQKDFHMGWPRGVRLEVLSLNELAARMRMEGVPLQPKVSEQPLC